MAEDGKQRREHYRIEYPISDRPKLHSNGVDFSVIDLSEGGMRLEENPKTLLGPRSGIEGDITFHDGTKVPVSGVVLRIISGQIIVRFSTGVPLSIIIAEQRRLISSYGGL